MNAAGCKQSYQAMYNMIYKQAIADVCAAANKGGGGVPPHNAARRVGVGPPLSNVAAGGGGISPPLPFPGNFFLGILRNGLLYTTSFSQWHLKKGCEKLN